MLKIGNEVSFENEVGDIYSGVITEVLSDSYDDVRLENGEVEYWSKKTKSYRPVKDRDMKSIFLEVESSRGKTDFVLLKEVLY